MHSPGANWLESAAILPYYELPRFNRGNEHNMREVVRVLIEFAVVAVLALGVGLAANAANPKGLDLTKNYFRKTGRPIGRGGASPTAGGAIADSRNHDVPPVNPTTSTAPSVDVASTRTASNTGPDTSSSVGSSYLTTPAEDEAMVLLAEMGLQPISHGEAMAAYAEAVSISQGSYVVNDAIVFVDARDDDHYHDGHIPGAWQLDHYYLDRYIDAVLPVCRQAEKIVIYCNGGECEDSEFAAGDLLEAGIEPNKIFIYVGGIKGWVRNGMPVETGPRLSGQIGEGTSHE